MADHSPSVSASSSPGSQQLPPWAAAHALSNDADDNASHGSQRTESGASGTMEATVGTALRRGRRSRRHRSDSARASGSNATSLIQSLPSTATTGGGRGVYPAGQPSGHWDPSPTSCTGAASGHHIHATMAGAATAAAGAAAGGAHGMHAPQVPRENRSSLLTRRQGTRLTPGLQRSGSTSPSLYGSSLFHTANTMHNRPGRDPNAQAIDTGGDDLLIVMESVKPVLYSSARGTGTDDDRGGNSSNFGGSSSTLDPGPDGGMMRRGGRGGGAGLGAHGSWGSATPLAVLKRMTAVKSYFAGGGGGGGGSAKAMGSVTTTPGEGEGGASNPSPHNAATATPRQQFVYKATADSHPGSPSGNTSDAIETASHVPLLFAQRHSSTSDVPDSLNGGGNSSDNGADDVVDAFVSGPLRETPSTLLTRRQLQAEQWPFPRESCPHPPRRAEEREGTSVGSRASHEPKTEVEVGGSSGGSSNSDSDDSDSGGGRSESSLGTEEVACIDAEMDPRMPDRYRSHNANALYSMPWDQRVFLPPPTGITHAVFTVLASPRFWEKVDWAVRASWLTVLPTMILTLEKTTQHLFPIPSAVANLAYWITMPTFGAGLRELFFAIKGFGMCMVLLIITIAINPSVDMEVLVIFFFETLICAFVAEEAKSTATYVLCTYTMQYITDAKNTSYGWAGRYILTLLIALGFGLAAFFVPFIRWSSTICEHYLTVYGNSMACMVRLTYGSFWVPSQLDRELAAEQLRKHIVTSEKCAEKIEKTLGEVEYEPHTGVYVARLHVRYAFVQAVRSTASAGMEAINHLVAHPHLATSPTSTLFGDEIGVQLVGLVRAMDEMVARISNVHADAQEHPVLGFLLNTQRVHAVESPLAIAQAEFSARYDAFQRCVADAHGKVLQQFPRHIPDEGDLVIGFYLFSLEQLAMTIIHFREEEKPRNNVIYRALFLMRDVQSSMDAVWDVVTGFARHRTIPRRMKEAIKMALCMFIAGVFQVYALKDSPTSAAAGAAVIGQLYSATGGESFQYATGRLMGTVLGSVVSLLSVQVARSRQSVLYVAVALLSFIGAFVQASPGFYEVGNTILGGIISVITAYTDPSVAMVCIQQNVFACLLYFLVTFTVWPVRSRTKVRVAMDMSLRCFQQCIERLLHHLDLPEIAGDVVEDVRMMLDEMGTRIGDLEAHLTAACSEPTLTSTEFPVEAWNDVVKTLKQLHATTTSLCYAYQTFTRSHNGAQDPDDDDGLGGGGAGGQDAPSKYAHWVVLHRISPDARRLSSLFGAAIRLFLDSLANFTLLSSQRMIQLRRGMLVSCSEMYRIFVTSVHPKLTSPPATPRSSASLYSSSWSSARGDSPLRSADAEHAFPRSASSSSSSSSASSPPSLSPLMKRRAASAAATERADTHKGRSCRRRRSSQGCHPPSHHHHHHRHRHHRRATASPSHGAPPAGMSGAGAEAASPAPSPQPVFTYHMSEHERQLLKVMLENRPSAPDALSPAAPRQPTDALSGSDSLRAPGVAASLASSRRSGELDVNIPGIGRLSVSSASHSASARTRTGSHATASRSATTRSQTTAAASPVAAACPQDAVPGLPRPEVVPLAAACMSAGISGSGLGRRTDGTATSAMLGLANGVDLMNSRRHRAFDLPPLGPSRPLPTGLQSLTRPGWADSFDDPRSSTAYFRPTAAPSDTKKSGCSGKGKASSGGRPSVVLSAPTVSSLSSRSNSVPHLSLAGQPASGDFTIGQVISSSGHVNADRRRSSDAAAEASKDEGGDAAKVPSVEGREEGGPAPVQPDSSSFALAGRIDPKLRGVLVRWAQRGRRAAAGKKRSASLPSTAVVLTVTVPPRPGPATTVAPSAIRNVTLPVVGPPYSGAVVVPGNRKEGRPLHQAGRPPLVPARVRTAISKMATDANAPPAQSVYKGAAGLAIPTAAATPTALSLVVQPTPAAAAPAWTEHTQPPPTASLIEHAFSPSPAAPTCPTSLSASLVRAVRHEALIRDDGALHEDGTTHLRNTNPSSGGAEHDPSLPSSHSSSDEESEGGSVLFSMSGLLDDAAEDIHMVVSPHDLHSVQAFLFGLERLLVQMNALQNAVMDMQYTSEMAKKL